MDEKEPYFFFFSENFLERLKKSKIKAKKKKNYQTY